MHAVIALVGRPNVGKSTLFNRLTRSQDALVAEYPGLTRDRRYGECRLGGWPLTIVDTGGLAGAPDTLQAAIAEQTLLAVREADLVVFLVDARSGLTAVDEDIADTLRREAKRVLVAVNKVDGLGEERALLDFYALGMAPVLGLSAAHGRGMRRLLAAVGDALNITPAVAAKPERNGEAAAAERPARVAFIGRPNVGKSTLINWLTGSERLLAYDQPGTTLDTIEVPFVRGGQTYALLDTAGVRRRGKVREKVEIFSIIKTLAAIDACHVAVMLLDATAGVTEHDLHLIGQIIDKGRALVVAVNKWDALDSDERRELRAALRQRMPFLDFTAIHYISARHGSGVKELFRSVHRAYRSAFVDLSAAKLTRLLALAVSRHQPPLVNGRRIKLRYAHQGGVNPPIIVIHGSRTDAVPAAYRRFLVNHFRQSLHLFGTPLRVEFRRGKNPYVAASGR